MRNDLFFETLSAFNDKGDNTETIAKCDEILKAEPKNRQALQLKAEAALKLKKMPAYTTAQRYRYHHFTRRSPTWFR